MASCSWPRLSQKIAFLIAITLARRVLNIRCEWQALLIQLFFKDSVALQSRHKFLTKVVSAFHLNQTICLPIAFPKSHSSRNKECLYTLDVGRALAFYCDRTKPVGTLLISSWPMPITWKARQCQHKLSFAGLVPASQRHMEYPVFLPKVFLHKDSQPILQGPRLHQ